MKGGATKGGTMKAGYPEGRRDAGRRIEGRRDEGRRDEGQLKGSGVKAGYLEGRLPLRAARLNAATLKGGAMKGGALMSGAMKSGALKSGGVKGGSLKGGAMEHRREDLAIEMVSVTVIDSEISSRADRDALTKAAPDLSISFRGGEGYEAVRSWGARAHNHASFPGAIASPQSAEEVSTLVKWATAAGIGLSLSNGGHGGKGFSRSLVIKMDKINSVDVAPEANPPTVTCGAGVRVAMVDAVTGPLGLATTLGNCGMVGVTGAMLGGGTGFMARWQGLTIDQLVTATVVLADGSIVDANETTNPDLFYALRGGGGNFGVLVKFTLKCFKVGWDDAKGVGRLYGGMRVLFNKRIGCGGNSRGLLGLMTKFRDYAESAPKELSVEMMVPLGMPVVMQMLTYKGPIAEAKAEARQWKKKLGNAVFSTLKTKSYFNDMQTFVAKMDGKRQAKGYHERWVSTLAALPDAALEALVRAAEMRPKGCECVIMMQRLGGQIDTPAHGADSCAYAHRGAGYWLVFNVNTSKPGQPEDLAKAEAAIGWLNQTCKALEPHIITKAGVGCIAPVGAFEPADARLPPITDSINVFGDKARVEKLRAIKLKFDPTNVFSAVENGMSGAHNIDPTSEEL